MKKALVLTAMITTFLGGFAHAGELNLLLDKLTEKGIISGGEAQEIRVGTQEEVKDEISRGANQTLPLWMQAIKLKGDLRLRYQHQRNWKLPLSQRQGRIRMRLGADAMVTDGFNVSIGLATGSSTDSRSTNQTMTSNFSKKSLWLDYAFAEYTANDWLAFSGGRLKGTPFWLPTDMVWDNDINPEGLAGKVSYKPSANKEFFLNGGFLVLNEDVTISSDPYMLVGQPGFAMSTENGAFDMKVAAAYYAYHRVQHGAQLANRPSNTAGYQNSNTTTTVTQMYEYGYDAIHPALEANYTLPSQVMIPYIGPIAFVGAFGEYIKNIQAPSGRGWIVGVKFGQRSVTEAGQWQARYSLRRLEKNAVLDSYPDSDFYGGSTGVRGHRTTITVGLARGVTFDGNYFYTESLSSNKKERLAQADLNFKF